MLIPLSEWSTVAIQTDARFYFLEVRLHGSFNWESSVKFFAAVPRTRGSHPPIFMISGNATRHQIIVEIKWWNDLRQEKRQSRKSDGKITSSFKVITEVNRGLQICRTKLNCRICTRANQEKGKLNLFFETEESSIFPNCWWCIYEYDYLTLYGSEAKGWKARDLELFFVITRIIRLSTQFSFPTTSVSISNLATLNVLIVSSKKQSIKLTPGSLLAASVFPHANPALSLIHISEPTRPY